MKTKNKILGVIVLGLIMSSNAYADNHELEQCKKKLVASKKLDLLYDMDFSKVVVGPTFYKLPFDAKQEFAKTANCFLVNGSGGYVNFDLVDWRTNKKIGSYSYGRLKLND